MVAYGVAFIHFASAIPAAFMPSQLRSVQPSPRASVLTFLLPLAHPATYTAVPGPAVAYSPNRNIVSDFNPSCRVHPSRRTSRAALRSTWSSNPAERPTTSPTALPTRS